MEIPNDFEKLVKMPESDGYPYSIKARHLMENFAWCDLLPSDPFDAGLRVELDEVSGVTARHTQRRMSITGSELPKGSAGDMLYHDGTRWVLLANPGSGFWVLAHNGSIPAWTATSECE